MKKFFTLAITMAFLSALMPTKVWAISKAKVTLIPDPANGGKVCVLSSSTGTPDYKSTSNLTQEAGFWDTGVKFTFWRFAQANPGYVFKGWSENSGDNSGGGTSNPSPVDVTGTTTTKEKTFYAIFARLAANTNSVTFSPQNVQSKSSEQTITISHAHAGQVTAELSGDHPSDFTISSTTLVQNSTSEGSVNLTITFTPTCSGNRRATLTIKSNNSLADVKINLLGTGVAHPQDISWDEPINTTIQVGEKGRSVSATAPSGLKVTYSSDNTSVLTVDADGNLTANAIGTAIITATVASDCYYASKFITKEFTVLSKKTPSFWLENDPDLTEKALLVDETTTVTVQNIDDSNSAFSITSSNNNIVSCSSVVDGIATITAKNAGTATLTFNQTNTDNVFPASSTFTFTISKHQGTLSINSNLGNRYKVDDEIGDYTSFYTASNNEVQVKVESSNTDVIAIENNKLKAVGAGKATITFSQAETYKWESTKASKEITVEKYTLSASIKQSTATWGETISNPFTVTDDRKNNFSGYSVTAVNPSIADYVNGQIVTYSTNGTAQARFLLSFGETYKYNALNQTVDLSVAAAAESECYVLEVTNEKSINGGIGSSAHQYSLSGKGEKLSIEVKKQAWGTLGFKITGYDANNQPTTIKDIANNDLSENYKTFEAAISENIVRIEISASGTLDKYYQNLKVTRLNYLNANATSVEAVGVPDGIPSRSFSVNYSDCGSTFTVLSSNPKITVSPATFNVPAGNGTQEISFTGNTQATGKETATITVYNQSRKVEVPITCYQQYKISFVTGQGASTVNPLIVTYDKAYTLPANPTKTGYTFAGWQKDGEDFDKGDTYTFANDITLTAVWTPNAYDLILDYKYTNAPANATRSGFFTYDAEYTFDEVPAETIHPVGYHFDGWYADAACTQAFSLSGTYQAAGNTTIYAKWAPNKYGLTLYYNYVGAPNNGVLFTQSDYFTYDATKDITEVPGENNHPTGYHFDGWYSDAECADGNRWESGTYTNPANLELYAKWTVNTYTLTFDLNGGSWNNVDVPNNQTTITYNQPFGTLLDEDKIQRSGYTFKGWYSDENFNTQVRSDDIVSENPPSKLYAKWEINGLTVTFNANYPNNRQGAPYSFETKVTIGQRYTLPTNEPSIEGYTFTGWKTEDNILVNASPVCNKGVNHTLYGCWEANKYDVTYSPNPGNWSGSTQSVVKEQLTYDQAYGQDNKFPADPTREGYTFQGWWTAEADGQQVTANTVFETAGNQTLYAHWSSNNYKLIFDYKDEDGTFEAVGVTYDASYPEVNIVPSRVGFTFVGWYDAKNNEVKLSDLRSRIYKTAGNERFFAHWIPNHYTVKFKTDATSDVIDSMSISVAYHDVYGILPKLKENGQEVTTEWYDAPTNGMLITPTTIFQPANVNQEFILYATTNPEKFALQLVDGNQTTTIGISEVQTYAQALDAAGIIKEETGKTFVGWSATQNGTPKDLSKGFSEDCQTLYALWEKTQLQVSFADGEHTNADYGVLTLAYGDTYGTGTRLNAAQAGLPSVAEVTGKTFKGWAYADNMFVNNTTPATFTTADHTLTAVWTANNYTIYLHENTGVDKTSTLAVTYGENYTLTAPAERTGYTFAGWFTKQEGGDLYDLTSRTYETVGDLHLFAHWTAKSDITVSFDADGGSVASNISATYGQAYGNLPTTSKEGYTFVGWFTAAEGGTEVTNATICKQTANHKLYAHWTANNYTIYLHENTGVDKTSAIDVTYGGNYTLTAPAERTGYTFEGWFTQQEEGDRYDLTTRTYETVGNLDLYAHWTAKSDIIVSFMRNDNTDAVASTASSSFDAAYELPTTTPTRDGYTFVGWFTAAEGGTEVTNTTICKQTANHNLYAHWTAINYTIYLHENTGVDKTSTIDVTYGETYTLTTPAGRTGYSFAGWFEQNAENAFVPAETYDRASDLHLFAHWTAVSGITVSFMRNDNTDAVASTAFSSFDAAYELPTTTPTREGYTFVGWFTAAEGGTEVTNTTICKQTANHNLYAHWTANNYTIYLHENTGVDKTSAIDVTYGGNYTLTAPAERTGYRFEGWFEQNTENAFVPAETYDRASDLHLYAHWTAISGITVSFDADGGEAVANNISATYGQAYGNLPTTTKDGYTFVGWFNADGNIVASTDICRNTTSHTLTAHWKAKAYTITFDANGGECHTTNKQVVYNTAIGKLPLVTRDGYTFNGWWADGATKATTEKDIFAGLDNLTLKADWEACQYTVSFLPEGGTTTADNKQVTYQAEYGELPTATRDGYTFDGWFTCDNEKVTSSTLYTIIGDQELHAHWTAQKFTVTFSVATGVTLDTKSKEVTFDSPYGELPTPTLAGYVFTGWYSAELGGSLITSTSTVSTASNHNLYARWTEADITIHFNSNGGSEVADQTRKYEGLYCEPALPTPTKEGYTLIGWYFEDGTLVTSTTTVDRTEAHTLTAYWAQANVPYLVLGDNWKISSPEDDNDYRFKTADGKNYSLSNIRVVAERQLSIGEYQADITIFLNGVFYGVEESTVLRTTENGNFGRFTANSSERATIQSAEMNTRWFNFDLYEESPGTWRLSISCGKQGNPTEVDNTESEQQARAKKYIEDGKVFIQTKEDRIYNASGQLVK